jgi:hypothetical protein
MIKIGYALYKSGYIKEDETEVFRELIAEAKIKEELIKFAKKKKLDVDDHYIVDIGYDVIEGLRVPDSGGECDYLHNYLPRKTY